MAGPPAATPIHRTGRRPQVRSVTPASKPDVGTRRSAALANRSGTAPLARAGVEGVAASVADPAARCCAARTAASAASRSCQPRISVPLPVPAPCSRRRSARFVELMGWQVRDNRVGPLLLLGARWFFPTGAVRTTMAPCSPARWSPSTGPPAAAGRSRLFSAVPAERRPGYANFALDDPALKLVLIESPGFGGSLNHLGVEVTLPPRRSSPPPAAPSRRGCLPRSRRAPPAAMRCRTLQDKVWPPGRAGSAGRSTPCSPTPAGSWRAPRRRRFRPRRRDQQPRSHRRIAHTVGLLRRLNGPVPPTPPVGAGLL